MTAAATSGNIATAIPRAIHERNDQDLEMTCNIAIRLSSACRHTFPVCRAERVMPGAGEYFPRLTHQGGLVVADRNSRHDGRVREGR